MTQNRVLGEPTDVLYRIKRGLAGYVSYLAACEMNESFSEFVLYEPILRILTARGYTVECEVPCPGVNQPRVGDRKRVDFVICREDLKFCMEVKWAKTRRPDLLQDAVKLAAFRRHEVGCRAFLCIFGARSRIVGIKLPDGNWREQGRAVFAEFGRTCFGCCIYELIE
jgi:hypothetical protein